MEASNNAKLRAALVTIAIRCDASRDFDPVAELDTIKAIADTALDKPVATTGKTSVVGNAQKLREELDLLLGWATACLQMPHDKRTDGVKECAEFVKMCCEDALKEPPRNCDVGTAEEQAKRFFDFCDGHMYNDHYKSCGSCPLWTSGTAGTDCELRWAQMPCKEGGAK